MNARFGGARRREPNAPLAERRERMVTRQLVRRGILDPRVLAAMRTVPRERFVAEYLAEVAYHDTPLPIEAGQTISQPYIVALMVEAAEIGPQDEVLDVGAGSGYAAAVASRLAGRVWSVERHQILAEAARQHLALLDYDNVEVRHGDGSEGWPEHAPYDAILVAAVAREVPAALVDQLALGGRLVLPVGAAEHDQQLVRLRRTGEHRIERCTLQPVRFVPLVSGPP